VCGCGGVRVECRSSPDSCPRGAAVPAQHGPSESTGLRVWASHFVQCCRLPVIRPGGSTAAVRSRRHRRAGEPFSESLYVSEGLRRLCCVVYCIKQIKPLCFNPVAPVSHFCLSHSSPLSYCIRDSTSLSPCFSALCSVRTVSVPIVSVTV